MPSATDSMRRRLGVDLLVYTVATFAITWTIVGLYIWDADRTTRAVGPMKLGAPMFYAAVYTPTVVSIVLTAIRDGRAGLVSLFASVFRFRAPWLWIAVSLLGYPLMWLVVSLIQSAATGTLASMSFTPWLVTLPMLVVSARVFIDAGALGEELGWRGFALPRLLELTDARKASLLLGVVWAVWHLPAFYVGSMSQSGLAFLPFVGNVIAFSVLMTWLFVHTRGSVFWAGIVPHTLFNLVPHAGIHPIGWITMAVAMVVLLLSGKHLRGVGRPAADIPQSALFATDGQASR
jgi:membrane protease YdiL (CAAX protease family)